MEKSVLVVGFGISGKSAAAFLEKKGRNVLVHDDHQDLKFHGDFSSIDQVVVSPGVPKTHPIYLEALQRNIEVIGEVELACRAIRQPAIAVTGTNGKTTVTMLIAHILEEAGREVKLLGNGGTPLTSEIEESSEAILVLELSSFQLETLQTPILDAAAILNITPDHLDRYDGMEEYARAKVGIHRSLKKGGQLFIEENCAKQYSSLLQGVVYQTYGESDPIALPCELAGKKTHETENFMAAFALCRQMGVAPEKIVAAFESFKKPPHRIEFVADIDGVSYYNDSKGTNIDAVIRCIQSLPGPIILIAGGVDKGATYRSWIEPLQGKVKRIMTLGLAASKIEEELKTHFPIERCRDLTEAVELSEKYAVSGDQIVLSPGCASFDMFKNYAHRGDEFKRLVLRSRVS